MQLEWYNINIAKAIYIRTTLRLLQYYICIKMTACMTGAINDMFLNVIICVHMLYIIIIYQPT